MEALDCRLSTIAGFETYKKFCDGILGNAKIAGRKAVVLSVPGEALFYCQYDFPWQPNENFNLKMLQPVGYLRLAWTNLAQTHGLKTVLFVQADVEESVKQNFHSDRLGWSLARAKGTHTVPKLSLPEKLKSSAGLFGWMISSSVINEVKRIQLKYINNEMVDPSILPREHSRILDDLLRESMQSSEQGKKEALKLYHWMAHVCPLAETSAYVRHGMTVTIGKDDGFVFLSLAFGIAQALKEHTAWTGLMGVVNSVWVKAKFDVVKAYHHTTVGTLGWRILCPDPNASLRVLMFSGGQHKMVESIIDTVSPMLGDHMQQFGVYAQYQLALWHRDCGNLSESSKAAELVLKRSKGSASPDIAILRLRAGVLKCEIASASAVTAEYSKAIRELEKENASAASTELVEYRHAMASMHLHRARLHVKVGGELKQVLASLDRGLSFAEDNPGLAAAPTLLMVATEIRQLRAIIAFAQQSNERFEAEIGAALRALSRVTDFRPGGKLLITSFGPLFSELKLIVWLLGLVGENKIQPSEKLLGTIRTNLPRIVGTLSECHEFVALKTYVSSVESLPMAGKENLFEVEFLALLRSLSGEV